MSILGGLGYGLVFVGAGGVDTISTGMLRPEDFGAKGDGVTDDTAAFIAAIAAMPGAYRVLQLSAKTYLISATLTIPTGCTLQGVGDGSRITTNTNTPMVKAGGDYVVFNSFRLTGNSVASLQNGLDSNGFSFVYINNIDIGPFMGNHGIVLTGNSAANIGPKVNNCRVQNAFGAAYEVAGAQYSQLNNVQSYGCGLGIHIGAGNALVTNGNFSLDTVGANITTGDGNDAHCIFSSCYFNHCTAHAITVGAIVNGAFFRGCNIYYADIVLTTSTGVIFEGCTIDVYTMYFDGSIGTQFVNCTWPMSNANTINSGFNAHPSTEFWIGQNLKLDGTPFIGGYVAMTPVAGAQTLTYAQSNASSLEMLAGSAAGFTLTSVLGPKLNSQQWMRNNTSQTATVQWATGASVALATATSALVTADGVNARKMLTGT